MFEPDKSLTHVGSTNLFTYYYYFNLIESIVNDACGKCNKSKLAWS